MGRKGQRPLGWCVVVVVSSVLASGCVTYKNQSFWECSKTKAIFEGDNFRVRKLGVQGTAACTYLFGGADQTAAGIALGDPNLLDQAMKDLHRQSDILGKACFLHNTNVEWTSRGLPGFLVIQRVTITADVVEFHKEYLDYKQRP